MGAVQSNDSHYVEGGINYLTRIPEKPAFYVRPSTPKPRPEQIQHAMPIHNARTLSEEMSLDTHGMLLRQHKTDISNFYDAQEVKSVYYPEVEQLVKHMTGAEKVLVFDHNVRCDPRFAKGEEGVSEPVRFAHNDYTLASGPQRVRDLLPAEEAEERLKHRFAMINVWRPIVGPVQDTPLAVCDAQSIEQDDFVATDLVYEDRTGEIYSVAFSPSQRWFYFPDMQPSEAMFLKCYDSMEDGRARFTAHSAFNDPTAPSDAKARESIEARTIAFFAE